MCGLIMGLMKANNKGDLMRLVYSPDEYKKVDSAYPQGLADRIRDIDPLFRGHFRMYDYNSNRYGVLENVAERVVEKFMKEASLIF
jgi:hypothetical protein